MLHAHHHIPYDLQLVLCPSLAKYSEGDGCDFNEAEKLDKMCYLIFSRYSFVINFY